MSLLVMMICGDVIDVDFEIDLKFKVCFVVDNGL